MCDINWRSVRQKHPFHIMSPQLISSFSFYFSMQAFSSLCKLFCTREVVQADVVAQRMLQFLFNKLKAIDANPDVLTRDKNNWPNMSEMSDGLLSCGMSFLQDAGLVADMIEYCILHKKPSYQDIGMQYFRFTVKKGATFSNPMVIRMMLGKARIALKRVRNARTKNNRNKSTSLEMNQFFFL